MYSSRGGKVSYENNMPKYIWSGSTGFSDSLPQSETPRWPTSSEDNKHKALIGIITLNIEGVSSNIAYIHSLKLQNTILCPQELFMWDFQKHQLKKLVPHMNHLVRCHDSYEPLSGFKLPRGQASVSIS